MNGKVKKTEMTINGDNHTEDEAKCDEKRVVLLQKSDSTRFARGGEKVKVKKWDRFLF